ncbi:NAD(P)/FAD-dependent oxidoreductase [Solwaraspora sp. WMMD1047]|uniref:NAD(P)/FAD-dependent oxidoreductase n=1 Tax=Solwaraspora sp. WMMD1047 TaxID=3016102 RepID=UPI002416B79C|nr:NAD(P)/FAD-dependent oxidoreductase [Solwaraspora sp. WMMD1047]MDG4831700.1 NAD(P)/FAD-dependent oxidoreductase [Solwaraspora sp. WMMD1047]
MAGAPAAGRPTDYDVVVVGARVAGSPTAMLLARRGYRVLLVDRMRFPSDVMSSHFIHAYGVARLARWGLLPRLLATGCPPVSLLASDWGEIRLTGTPPPYEGIQFGVCPRRIVLDQLLLTAAIEAGVEFEEAVGVTDLLVDGDRVTGVRLRREGGRPVPVTARYVVGADGMRSFVARTVGAAEYHTIPSLTTTFLTYFENLPMDRLLIHWRPGRCVPAIPTHDGLTVVLCGWSHDEWRTYRSDVEGNYFDTIYRHASPEFAERVRGARRVARIIGSHHAPNFFRKPYGPGWALVGDAGYHKDPVTALGISDAFRDVELLTDALDQVLAGERAEQDALGSYERRRNELAEPLFRYTIEQARYEPLDRLKTLVLRALEADEEARSRFFGVLAGSVHPEEFSSLTNVAGLLVRTGLMPASRHS